MTIGTGIVVSISIICVTFLLLCLMGMKMAKAKEEKAEQYAVTIAQDFADKLKNYKPRK